MSNTDVKVITTKLEDKPEYPDDYSDCTAEELQNINEMEKIIAEVESPAVTEVLDNLKFKTDIDKMVFDRLPLTTNQKEYLLLSVNTDLLNEKLPDEHGVNPNK